MNDRWRCCDSQWEGFLKFCGYCGKPRPTTQSESSEADKRADKLRREFVSLMIGPPNAWSEIQQSSRNAWRAVEAKARELCGAEAAKWRDIANDRREKLEKAQAVERELSEACGIWKDVAEKWKRDADTAEERAAQLALNNVERNVEIKELVEKLAKAEAEIARLNGKAAQGLPAVGETIEFLKNGHTSKITGYETIGFWTDDGRYAFYQHLSDEGKTWRRVANPSDLAAHASPNAQVETFEMTTNDGEYRPVVQPAKSRTANLDRALAQSLLSRPAIRALALTDIDAAVAEKDKRIAELTQANLRAVDRVGELEAELAKEERLCACFARAGNECSIELEAKVAELEAEVERLRSRAGTNKEGWIYASTDYGAIARTESGELREYREQAVEIRNGNEHLYRVRIVATKEDGK